MRPRLQRRSSAARRRRTVHPAPASKQSAARTTFDSGCSGTKTRNWQLHQERPVVGIALWRPRAVLRSARKPEFTVARSSARLQQYYWLAGARDRSNRRCSVHASIPHCCNCENGHRSMHLRASVLKMFSQEVNGLRADHPASCWSVYKHHSLLLATLQLHLLVCGGSTATDLVRAVCPNRNHHASGARSIPQPCCKASAHRCCRNRP